MGTFVAWIVGICVILMVMCATVTLAISVAAASFPSFAAATLAYCALVLHERRRQHLALTEAGNDLKGFVLTRRGSVIDVAADDWMLIGRVRISRLIVIGGTVAAGLVGIAASVHWWDWFDHVRIWAVGWHTVPPALAIAIAGITLIYVTSFVERVWPISFTLRRSLDKSVVATVAKRRRAFTAISALQDADESLRLSTLTLRGGRANYVDELDRFLRARAPEIIRSPSLLDSELSRLVVEASDRESRFRQAASAYTSSLGMHHAVGRAIAIHGSASMFSTIDNTLLSLESERERFVESEDLAAFLARVADIQEVLAGFDRLRRDEGCGSSARSSSAPTPYDVLGITPDASADTVKQVYRKLVNIYHEGSSVFPNSTRHTAINEAYQAILKQRS